MRRSFALGSLALAPLLAFACGNSGSSSTQGADGGASSSGGTTSSSGGAGSSSGSPAGSSSGTSAGSSSGSTSGSSSGAADAGTDAGPAVGASVLMFHNHVNRDGLFVDGALTEAKAATFARDTTFNGSIAGNDAAPTGVIWASPLYVENGVGGKGTFYVATEDGTVYAMDEATGAIVWQKNVAPAPTAAFSGSLGNVSPLGITGTPAIDLDTRLIVFDSPTANASGFIATHIIYALSIDTGAVAWSLDVSTMSDPTTSVPFYPPVQNQRSAVLVLNGIAYVAYSGHLGDQAYGTDYHGWVVGVPLSGTGAKAWATQAEKAGIWGCGGPSSDGTSVFVTTGNAVNDSATWAESEGLFRLGAGPVFSGPTETKDFFTPYNWASFLDPQDLDISGSEPLVIDAPALTPSALVMVLGKDGYLYLVDRTNLGGIATSSELANVGALDLYDMGGEISGAAAWATVGGATYVAVRPNGAGGSSSCPNSTSGDLIVVKLDPAASQKMSVVWCAASNGNGAPIITTSDGTNDPMVWDYAAEGTQRLYSWDLVTGNPVFTGGGASDTGASVRHFTTPIVVHGRIFTAGDNQLFAFAAH